MKILWAFLVICHFAHGYSVSSLLGRPVTHQCQDKWYHFGNQCYWFSKDRGTFEDAKKSCEDMDAKLIEPMNKAEHEGIFELASKTMCSYFIGIKSDEQM